jgi:heme-degrading monooxygenase HmoA
MVQAWTEDAQFMKHQRGFISTQLHRAIGDGCAYLNYAVWESTAAFRAVFSNPQFQAKLDGSPSSVVASPHFFQRVAVPGICGAA